MKLQRFDAPAKLKLDDIPTDPPDSMKKGEARDRFDKLSSELFELQDLMWGSRTHSVLMVLQGRDAAGKDGTVKHLSGALNPRGIMVTSFGVPTTEERQHDFLWRVHKRAPPPIRTWSCATCPSTRWPACTRSSCARAWPRPVPGRWPT